MTENKRNPKRIRRIMDLIETIWEENPDMRFFQLMEMLQHKYSSENNNFGRREAIEKESTGYESPVIFIDLFYLEDDSFEAFLSDYVHGEVQRDPDRNLMNLLESNNVDELVSYIDEHDVNQEINGASLLYWAVFLNQAQIVKKLLELGADPNKKDLHGRSPLEVGAYCGFYNVCKLLLVFGAKTEGALQRAEEGWNENYQEEIVKLIQDWKNKEINSTRSKSEDGREE
ncbi:ankyrin repeat domain-containing protein [Ornithinibacillus sp. FSL M8-0202]|uniref:ankyrin repeat domain-containing protein n=1 Tax=Ornithinibacillus sp. FSL M8-0202 TaxID=2921616 RepID=UPI0030D2A32A